MVFPANDIYIGQSLALYGEYGEQECQTLLGFVHPGDVVIDAGANVGAFTIPLAIRVGPNGRVHAFEPQRFVHQLLCANVALNGLGNVHTHHAALGASAGSIIVPVPDYMAAGNFGAIELGSAAGASETVPVATIDSLRLTRLALLKADVEGMEAAVLAGGRETIERCRPVLYLEADRPATAGVLSEMLAVLDYEVRPHSPPLFNPDNHAGESRNVFGAIVSINLIATPRGRQ